MDEGGQASLPWNIRQKKCNGAPWKNEKIIVKYIELYQLWPEESTRKFIYLIP